MVWAFFKQTGAEEEVDGIALGRLCRQALVAACPQSIEWEDGG